MILPPKLQEIVDDFAGMTREDLSAIYAALREQKPVVNRVNRFPEAQAAK